MTLPSSGIMTWEMIRAEFGGGYPVNISDYYRGGARVPNTPQNANIPTSGLIAASHFYGAAAGPPVYLAPQTTVNQVSASNSRAGIRVDANGQVMSNKGGVYANLYAWLLSGSASSYDIRVTQVGGIAPTGSPVGTWLPLSSTREWSIMTTSTQQTCVLNAEIRPTGGGATLVSGQFNMVSSR